MSSCCCKRKIVTIIFSFFTITLVTQGTPKESHIKSRHFLRTYLNSSKNYYQTRTNKEMLQHDYHFFGNIMIFSQKNVIEYFFRICFSPLCKISNKKKTHHDMCICFQ
jgi:hypothetical protein